MSEDTRFSLDEPRIIEGPESWLETHTRTLLFIILAVVALAIGAGVWWQKKNARDTEAERLFADATTAAAWSRVANDFSGTSAAPLALLQLAQEARTRNALDESLTLTERFLKEYPRHPFRPAAELARAQIWEATGKTAEAQKAYEALRRGNPPAPTLGAAALGLARILEKQGNTTAARQVLSDFVASERPSAFTAEANRLLKTLPEPAPVSLAPAPAP
jgi:outer membrane protein assembly factor BamD (BamD/ComL family)